MLLEQKKCPSCGRLKAKEDFEKGVVGIYHTVFTHCFSCRLSYIRGQFCEGKAGEEELDTQEIQVEEI